VSPHSLDRRSLLKKGLVGGVLLAVAGPVALLSRSTSQARHPSHPLRALTPAEYAIFAAVAARLSPGDDDKAATWPSAESLDVAGKLDALLARLHPAAIKDFRQLLHVFENALTGLASAGVPRTFTRSSPSEQDARLEAWRHSRVALFRSGYQAMKRLGHAIYFSSPETYAHFGYPGPPVVDPGPA
jgi:hypothetical protein